MKTKTVALLVFLLILAGGAIAGLYWLRVSSPPSFEDVGGTLLIYELAPEAEESRTVPELTALTTKVLERRLDPHGHEGILVTFREPGRVEIRIPRTNEIHAETVERIKSVLSVRGRLEFRIVANIFHDKAGIEDSRIFFQELSNKKELEELQKEGSAPPGPREPASQDLRKYHIRLPGHKALVTYSWVEIDAALRRSLNLDNAAEFDPQRKAIWSQASESRGQAVFLGDKPYNRLLSGALFYSRQCVNRHLSEKERAVKKVDYFVLVRNPEFDSADPKQVQTPRIDGTYLVNAQRSEQGDQAVVQLEFSEEGGRLFRGLTRPNAPRGNPSVEGVVRHHLAIMLDGLVMSVPTVNHEISTQATISGNFTSHEAEKLARVLRGGALPSALKRLPVSEMEIPPKMKSN